jgi:hypothetical protein
VSRHLPSLLQHRGLVAVGLIVLGLAKLVAVATMWRATDGLASFALHRWLDSPSHSQDRRLQAELARPSALLRLRIT